MAYNFSYMRPTRDEVIHDTKHSWKAQNKKILAVILSFSSKSYHFNYSYSGVRLIESLAETAQFCLFKFTVWCSKLSA